MKKFLKIFFALLILVIIGAVVFIMTFDLDRYRQPIVSQMSTALNRPVSIEKLELKLSLVPTVTVSGIKIGNPVDINEKMPFAQIDSIDVTLSLIPLIRKEIQIDGINIGVADVSLIEMNGRNNWSLGAQNEEKNSVVTDSKKITPEQNDLLSQLRVNNISLKKLTVHYQKEKNIQKAVISDLVLKQLKVFSTVIAYDNQTIKLSGTVNDLLDLVQKKKDYLFNLEAEAFDATVKLSGSIGDVSTFDNLLLSADIYAKDLRKTLSLIGVVSDKIPDNSFVLKSVVKGNLNELIINKLDIAIANDLEASFKGMIKDTVLNPVLNFEGSLDLRGSQLAAIYGLKPLNIQVAATGTKENLLIKQLILNAGKSDIVMQANIALKETVPFIKGDIKSNYFDLADVTADSNNVNSGNGNVQNTTHAAAVPVGMFSDKPFDLSALKSLNAQLGISFAHLKVTDEANNFYTLAAQIQLLNSLLTINPIKVQMLNGTVSGSIQVNAQSQIPVFKSQLIGSDLVLDKLKSVSEILKGSVANMALNLTAIGKSPKALVSTLTGNVEMELTEGKIVNKWFNSLPKTVGLFSKNKSFSYSKTDEESLLNCAAMNLSIKNGLIMMNKNIAVETSSISVVVSGQINLPQETLSISLVPSLSQLSDKANNKLMLTQLIRIEGPFMHPTTRLDAQGIVDNLAQKGIEKGLNKLSKKLLGESSKSSDVQETDDTAAAIQPVGSLCRSALGHKLRGKVTETPVSQPVLPVKTPSIQTQKQQRELSPQDQIKDQLMRSLTDVLKK